MRKLMAIFAHPDDEGAIGGTLAHYARDNTEVMLVCGTRGEVGEISDPALATPENLGEVRQRELETACEILGIQFLEFLDYRDSGMDGTSQNGDSRALVQADPTQVIGQLVGLIRRFQPDAVVTFEPFGWYGHPDHIAISRWTTEAVALSGDEDAYPDSVPEWQPERFYHAVLPFSKFRSMIEAAVEAGLIEGSSIAENIPQEQQLHTEAMVTHVIDVTATFDIKQRAMVSHKTQFSEDHMFKKVPREKMIEASGNEYFIQVYPTPEEGSTEKFLADLFAAGEVVA